MPKRQQLVQMAKYAFVGVLNTGVDFAVFCALVYGAGFASVWAQPLSYGAGLANSYFLNRKWTFQVGKRRQAGEMIRFAAVNALSFAVATGALLALEQAGLASAIAKAGSVFVSLAVNFAGYKLWVFRTEPRGERAS